MSRLSSRPARGVMGHDDAAPPSQIVKHQGRPHLVALAWGVLDAHVNHLDYFDTSGGDEIRRLFRQRRVAGRDRRGSGQPKATPTHDG